MHIHTRLLLLLICILSFSTGLFSQERPNVILIYADDLGYGDASCYGASKLQTPNIDQLAAGGIKFTHAHTSSATCTPSRYALITGMYPWRKKGTGVLPGDAALIVPTDKITLPKVFKEAGYQTGIVGKWHLGLGTQREKDWNTSIKPGPVEVGFDYSFIFPATADRVPTVFIENHDVVGLRADDPIKVDYKENIGNEPIGRRDSSLLKMKSTDGHDYTIVNGIGRIGYMSGGKTTRWTDEEIGYTFLHKAEEFIRNNSQQPFFLFYSLTEPHVPRMPATIFKGKSGLGFRGDAILQLDWAVGEIMKELKLAGIEKNTIILFTSDNGPVKDDGYDDGAVTQLNGHTPAGKLRGGKYSIFEGGTRVPFIMYWPGKIKPQLSDAMISQVDLLASFAGMLGQKIPGNEATDSESLSATLVGKDKKGRQYLVEHAGTLAIVAGNWKYIEPHNGVAYYPETDTETGNAAEPQLYDLNSDIGEKNNLAKQYPEKVKAMQAMLEKIKEK
ncbi:MAG TPA: arylsulfatase [Chitinophagaceae bacterium]|nr:arylsulfatase [Chitinophagaceae bacterium]MCB9054235.1 arylsulfatase [Chitinophagales bacterium]HPG10313.1 arylsulfatase [Chitinophagaceae bacterium]HRX93195.1 arylsulfatase [Chitinophagaceae bacterium]